MDRNTITGFVLIGLLLTGMFIYNMREADKLKKTQQTQQTAQTTANDTTVKAAVPTGDTTTKDSQPTSIGNTDSTNNAAQASQSGPFVQPVGATPTMYTLENEDVKISISSKGGEISGIQLKKYKTFDNKPLILLQGGDNKKTYDFVAGSSSVSTSKLIFESQGATTKGDTTYLSLRLNAGEGKYFEQLYALPKTGYVVGYKVNLVNLDQLIPRNVNYLAMNWTRQIPKLEKDKNYENRYTALYFKYQTGDINNLPEAKDGEKNAEASLQWISYKQQFFNTSLISYDKDGFKNGVLHSTMEIDSQHLKKYDASVILPYQHRPTETYNMAYYLGPNRISTLKSLDVDLNKIVSLGFFGVINKWFIIPIFHFLEKYISNYGIIILILTLLTKILLTPLTYRSQLSMAKMKVLKPELDELKERYKDDQQKFGAEQMKLYSKAGVNPLGGCLPTVLIMPVLLAMYNFFPSSIELRQAGFLWASDLSTYDSIFHLPFNIPFYGDHVSLFTLLMTATSVLYSVANSQLSGTAEGPMKFMPYFMPIILMGMFNSFPAALTYFYLLNNLLSYGQQFFIQKFFIDEAALHKQIQENKKKPAKQGGWADNLRKKMEEAQRQQQQTANKPKTKSKK